MRSISVLQSHILLEDRKTQRDMINGYYVVAFNLSMGRGGK